MKRVSIYFLAFLTFWMSTWLVTDIHDVSEADQSHPMFSVQQTQPESDVDVAIHDHELHCGVCSYDHGGHMGQTLVVVPSSAAFIPAQKLANPQHPDLWFSRNTSPKLRPPIA